MNEAIERLRAHTGPLRYRVHTVVRATGGVDATLYRGDAGVPLDIWTPQEAACHQPLAAHTIVAASEEMSREIVVELVTAWCRDHLGVGEVVFEQLES